MTTIAARILRVMSGHSSTAMLIATDNNGRELRLEVPVDAVQGVGPNQVLVLQWSVHTIPSPVPIEVVVTSAPESSPTAAPPTETRPTSASGEIHDSTHTTGKLEQLLGLSPGRLRGL